MKEDHRVPFSNNLNREPVFYKNTSGVHLVVHTRVPDALFTPKVFDHINQLMHSYCPLQLKAHTDDLSKKPLTARQPAQLSVVWLKQVT